ncbi:hypothetical protein [Chryseobacterium sp.]|uniref:hypothetical protein n=1 Tax=Chryseobacterium sp. TaxID=1871047 RepID=UPI003890FE76
MKNYLWIFAITFFTLLSCSSDEDDVQNIDQILDIYIKDPSGNDLLHPTKDGSYTVISMNDNLSDVDIAPVNFSRKMIIDSTYYLQYVSGAKRQLVDDNGAGDKMYKSQIILSLTKKISSTQMDTPIVDTLNVFYRMTPSAFEVSKVYYNSELKFTKGSNEPNVVTIIK